MVLRLLVLLVVVVLLLLLLSSPEHMVVAEWPLIPHPIVPPRGCRHVLLLLLLRRALLSAKLPIVEPCTKTTPTLMAGGS